MRDLGQGEAALVHGQALKLGRAVLGDDHVHLVARGGDDGPGDAFAPLEAGEQETLQGLLRKLAGVGQPGQSGGGASVPCPAN